MLINALTIKAVPTPIPIKRVGTAKATTIMQVPTIETQQKIIHTRVIILRESRVKFHCIVNYCF